MIKMDLLRGDCFVTKIPGIPNAFYEVLELKEEKVKMTLISETQEHCFSKSTVWFPVEYVNNILKPNASPLAKKRFAEASIIMSGYYTDFLGYFGKLQKWESTELTVGNIVVFNKEKEKAFCQVTDVDQENQLYRAMLIGIEEPSLKEMTLYSDVTMENELHPGKIFVHIPDDMMNAQLFFFKCMESNLRSVMWLPEWE